MNGATLKIYRGTQVMMMLVENNPTLFGLWYRDILVRAPQGWRLQERVQEFGWIHNAPPTAMTP